MISETVQPYVLLTDYKYLFIPMTRVRRCRQWEVREFDGRLVGDLIEDILTRLPTFRPNNSEIDENDVSSQFDIFKKNCPAYYLHPVRTLEVMENMNDSETYLTLFLGSLLCRQWYSTNKVERKEQMNAYKRFLKMQSWLSTTDFFDAPASSRYHDSNQHGLLEHTLKVVEKLSELYECYSFERYSSTYSFTSAVLVALVHDWCKIGYYEQYCRNVKNEITGQWEQVDSFRVKDITDTCLGHGVSSMFLANKFFNLSTAEAQAIRWHMGEYNVAPNEMNELHQANAHNPLCYLIQFADRLACTNY